MPLKKKPRFVAGIDAAFSDDATFSAACLYRYPELELIEQTTAVRKTAFPYIPEYLFFREGPAIVAAIQKLKIQPEILLIDAQGIAHPRGIGSASHLGVMLGIPSIGCAKSRLVGSYKEPGGRKGSYAELMFNETCVGAVLRTQDGVKPIFVSPGQLIDIPDAISITLGCVGKYRVPEPIRCADMLSRRIVAQQ